MHIENQSSITYSHKKVRTYVRPWFNSEKKEEKQTYFKWPENDQWVVDSLLF